MSLRRRSSAIAIVALVTSAWLASQPGIGRSAGRASPAQYLIGSENADGGFGPSPGQPSSELYAGWAALGLASAGYNPASVSHDGHSLLAYIEGQAPSDAGSIERTILVAHAAGASVTDFGGRNLVRMLQVEIRRNGSVSNQVNWTSFAVLALRAAGLKPSRTTLNWIARQRDSDGGFSFSTSGGQSDVDDTGAALEGLAGDRAARATISRAVRFLRHQQNRDGGFPSEPGATSNAQSTAFAIQGLIAVGVRLSSMPHGSPDRYLDSLRTSSGYIRYSRSLALTPVWVTGEALMALQGKALPLAPVGS